MAACKPAGPGELQSSGASAVQHACAVLQDTCMWCLHSKAAALSSMSGDAVLSYMAACKPAGPGELQSSGARPLPKGTDVYSR